MIQHNFKTKAHNLEALFDGVNNFSTFMGRLQRQAQNDPLRYTPTQYCGDGFEFFVELFLHLHPCDNRVGVYNYIPKQENDNGVDGIGENIKGEPCAVQIKFRSDVREELTATKDHLSNLITDGMLAHGIVSDQEDKKNFRHFVFTTSKGLNFYTDKEMYKGMVRCFGYNEFKSMLNNNIQFWNQAREIIQNIIEHNKGVS